jgi:hypothetical protein
VDRGLHCRMEDRGVTGEGGWRRETEVYSAVLGLPQRPSFRRPVLVGAEPNLTACDAFQY